MTWRQYDTIYADLKNVAFKATLAPLFRTVNSSRVLNRLGILPRRIVICGCPRSGTTLMNELMRCFHGVFVMNREEYAMRLPYLVSNKTHVVTKHPLDFRNLEVIEKRLREPFIIFLMRDPRDVVVSKHYKSPDQYLVRFNTWRDSVRAFQASTYGRMLLVRFEDLLQRPEDIQADLAAALGLEVQSDFREFHRHVGGGHQDINSLGGVRPLDPANTSKYMREEHFGRVRQQLEAFPEMSDYLIEYGYETDRQWEGHFFDREEASAADPLPG